MKKLTPRVSLGILFVGMTLWTGQIASAQVAADTGASGGNNVTPKHNVNNTGGAGVNGQGTATSGGATSSTSGGNPNGGQVAPGETSSGSTTHVNTQTGLTPGDGNSGVMSTPPSGVSPGTGASPNPH
jgi:hypothetical protein